MAQYRCQIAAYGSNDPARDQIVNTFYLDTDLDPLTGTHPEGLIADAVDVFLGNMSYGPGIDRLHGRIYKMSDPEPRLPISEKITPFTASTAAGAPREVALCLSYFADRNTPRRRGRMYMGPFRASEMALRPGLALRQQLQALANGISGLGGANVQWVQYSPTTGEFHNVTDYWIDDEWDTMRSRGLRATTRLAGTVNG